MPALPVAGPAPRRPRPRWRLAAALVPALLAAAALPAAAMPLPVRAEPVLVTEHVSATLSTLSAAPGDEVDVILTMTVPPEGVPPTADPMTVAVLSLKSDSGLWNVSDGCEVLAGSAPTACRIAYATQVANWYEGGIREAGVVQLLFRATVAPDADPGPHTLTLRGTPGTLPLEKAEAAGVFTVTGSGTGQAKRPGKGAGAVRTR
ncbi:hypothetical protein CFP65_0479 [Kitasatospora sp. MMS16-BH015]|uniref:hypothetical protein n=1 Tax=Kitasatospora sp. MMS16-BH015 TaxID=2018025 RepID=UPI000CA114A9|nr:hypothetical protein [Kitasatospora sp. MMS16-BH015]AUG75442.1 hypothetical protein CFP65_0479 [Kitasatospora sp. MMS16-BH015]